MGNPAATAAEHRKNGDGGVYRNKERGADGKYPPDINAGSGKKHRVGKENGVDNAGSTQKLDVIGPGRKVKEEGGEPGEETGPDIEEQKFLGTHLLFDGGSKEKEAQHVEKQVLNATVGKHVGEEAPDLPAIKDVAHVKREGPSEPRVTRGIKDKLCEKHEDVDPDKVEDSIVVAPDKGLSKQIHAVKVRRRSREVKRRRS